MKPSQLDMFMYALMKQARREDFMDFLEEWEISEVEYEEIEKWFKEEHDVKL